MIDSATRRIEKALTDGYLSKHPAANLTVYRYNASSIRVRIVDCDFEGRGIIERETEVLPIIRALPDRLQEQITMLFLVTRGESERSMLSEEFDHPTPSRL